MGEEKTAKAPVVVRGKIIDVTLENGVAMRIELYKDFILVMAEAGPGGDYSWAGELSKKSIAANAIRLEIPCISAETDLSVSAI